MRDDRRLIGSDVQLPLAQDGIGKAGGFEVFRIAAARALENATAPLERSGLIMTCFPSRTVLMRRPSSMSAPAFSPQMVVMASLGSAMFSAQLDFR